MSSEFENQNSQNPNFEEFAREKGYIQDTINEENKFAIKTLSGNGIPEYFIRDYFIANPSGGFASVAEAQISALGIKLTKFGREIPAGKYSYHEEEVLQLFGDEKWGYEPRYELLHIKGQKELDGFINNVEIRFNKDGSFDAFSVDVHDGTTITSAGLKSNHIQQSFDENNGNPFVFNAPQGTSVIVENNGDSYALYLVSADSKLRHKVVAKRQLNIDELIINLELESIMKDPFQPPNGEIGKGFGDKTWRFANLGKEMGVSVIPADDVLEEEFDSRGFRQLVDKIKDNL